MTSGTALELSDIQAGAPRPRPSPYAGACLLRIDDRLRALRWLAELDS